jgi:hypothetical protein
MNYFGKALVLVNLLLSGFGLAWAVAVYTDRTDWGWKDPRQHLGTDRVASEIDKRTALIKDVLPVVAAADKGVDAYQKALTSHQVVLAANHQWYNAALKQLEDAAGKIDVLEIKVGKQGVEVDPQTLRPVLDKKVTFTDADKKTTEVDRSTASYRAELQEDQGKAEKVQAAIRQWVEKQKDLTLRLDGTRDEAGKVIRPGLYTLLNHENEVQESLKKEMAYLRPRWVQELVDAQLLLERQDSLRARLAELKAVRAARR